MKNFRGLGWEPEVPAIDDLDHKSQQVDLILKASPTPRADPKSLPLTIDLTPWCSPVEDQGRLYSCTSHAAIGLLEYLQRRAFDTHLDLSRRFLYKATRKLLLWEGDQGAYLRTTMDAMLRIGVPPEEYWPYDEDKFDEEPGAFCYALAGNYKTNVQYRLDALGVTPGKVLDEVRQHLCWGIPVAFGFTMYSSMPEVGTKSDGSIPYPSPQDTLEGGHAMLAVGYDDTWKIPYQDGTQAKETTGALKVRNSWGTDWGNGGYGWLPYAYIQEGLTADFWTITNQAFKGTALYKMG